MRSSGCREEIVEASDALEADLDGVLELGLLIKWSIAIDGTGNKVARPALLIPRARSLHGRHELSVTEIKHLFGRRPLRLAAVRRAGER